MTRLSARFFLTIALFAVVLAWPAGRQGEAHPHVWIDATVTPKFEAGVVVALEVDWRFDEFYGTVVAEDFDTDGNGTLDPPELAALAEVSKTSLAEYSYFTRVYLDSGPAIETVVETLTAHQDDEALHYRFTVVLPEPINPSERTLSFSLYDETYYVDVALDQVDPVRLSGEGAEACHFALVEDTERPFYFGMVVPIRVDIVCNVS